MLYALKNPFNELCTVIQAYIRLNFGVVDHFTNDTESAYGLLWIWECTMFTHPMAPLVSRLWMYRKIEYCFLRGGVQPALGGRGRGRANRTRTTKSTNTSTANRRCTISTWIADLQADKERNGKVLFEDVGKHKQDWPAHGWLADENSFYLMR